MGLTSKAVTASNIYLKDKNEIVFSATKNCSIFKNYFSSFAHNVVFKLPLSPDVFTESKIASYYGNNATSKNLNFHVLAQTISQLCNLSINLKSFPRSCKIAKLKLLFKKRL